MDYSNVKYHLVLPEYGMNIQKMVDHTTALEDRNERLRAAQSIISIMGNLFPYLRDTPDFKHKLWDHLAIMSDFKLDIDYPYALPQKEVLYCKPKQVNYLNVRIRLKHYGLFAEKYIEHAIGLPEGEEKLAMVNLIVNYMKRSFLMWNRDNVDNQVILSDLERLSGGKLKYQESDLKIIPQHELVTKIPNKKKTIQKNQTAGLRTNTQNSQNAARNSNSNSNNQSNNQHSSQSNNQHSNHTNSNHSNHPHNNNPNNRKRINNNNNYVKKNN